MNCISSNTIVDIDFFVGIDFFSILAKFRTNFFSEMNFDYLKGPSCTLERIFLILVPGESRFLTVLLLCISFTCTYCIGCTVHVLNFTDRTPIKSPLNQYQK